MRLLIRCEDWTGGVSQEEAREAREREREAGGTGRQAACSRGASRSADAKGKRKREGEREMRTAIAMDEGRCSSRGGGGRGDRTRFVGWRVSEGGRQV